MFDVYIAGALTRTGDPERMKRFFEDIAAVCEECGFSAYLPHKHTDPREHPDHTPQYVYKRNHDMVANARFIVAYVGEPSLGVGGELEIARNNKTGIILLFSRDERVSRMARGNPAVVKEIMYDSEEEALETLREFLREKAG